MINKNNVTHLFNSQLVKLEVAPLNLSNPLPPPTPQEILYSQQLGKKRQIEFIVSRSLGQKILKDFNVLNFPLIPDNQGLVKYPQGFCGSITHSKEFCIVVVSQQLISIGIDLEEIDRLKEKLWTYCFNQSEINFLKSLPIENQITFGTFGFSAKEAFYKYQFPLTKKWLGFKDVQISQWPTHTTTPTYISNFKIQLLKDDINPFKKDQVFDGQCLMSSNLIFTTVYS